MQKSNQQLSTHLLPNQYIIAFGQSVAFGNHWEDHKIDFYALVWYRVDFGTQYIDFEPYPITKNSIYLLAKNQIHCIRYENLPKC